MAFSDVLKSFILNVPVTYPDHMFCYFAMHAANGNIRPFARGLFTALDRVDKACSGYANEMISRIAAIKGAGDAQYEALLQILAEIYVTCGAVEAADRDEAGRELFRHEPAINDQKNPEFESRAANIWYAVEVKTPGLLQHIRVRAANPYQLTARLPQSWTADKQKTLPRDNPVKDFLLSANEKFQAYSTIRPDAYRILTIVWDDFCNEPITALLHPHSGLLTPKSFFKDRAGQPVQFPYVDAVLICRYQHQLIRSTREEPLIDGEVLPFAYHHYGFPMKAFVANPAGRVVPDELLQPLNAVRQECLTFGAEYNPMDLVMWIGGDGDAPETASDTKAE